MVITLAVIVVETLALGLAAWSSGSAALSALTAQSVAGLVVEGLLLVGSLRSGRPADDRHPLGYGREAYFWSLFAALAIFLGDGALALGEAWRTLGEEPGQDAYDIEYAVLVGVLIANVWSLRAVVGPVGRSRIRSYAGELRRTSDPIVVTVVLDNATSVAGIRAARPDRAPGNRRTRLRRPGQRRHRCPPHRGRGRPVGART
ncbi:MAG TPA: cation transporter [Actinomycetes bacterium]|nr:cation transporter [Actinomycetes bacterium]